MGPIFKGQEVHKKKKIKEKLGQIGCPERLALTLENKIDKLP
jgi:hypothetical protein